MAWDIMGSAKFCHKDMKNLLARIADSGGSQFMSDRAHMILVIVFTYLNPFYSSTLKQEK